MAKPKYNNGFYTMQNGEQLKYPVLPYNTPRVSGVRTGNDKEYLKSNEVALRKLQHNIG